MRIYCDGSSENAGVNALLASRRLGLGRVWAAAMFCRVCFEHVPNVCPALAAALIFTPGSDPVCAGRQPGDGSTLGRRLRRLPNVDSAQRVLFLSYIFKHSRVFISLSCYNNKTARNGQLLPKHGVRLPTWLRLVLHHVHSSSKVYPKIIINVEVNDIYVPGEVCIDDNHNTHYSGVLVNLLFPRIEYWVLHVSKIIKMERRNYSPNLKASG